MKIVHKIIIANLLSVILMVAIYFVASQKVDLVLAKLRFVEMADDVNFSFLEMRLLEKNYFLYNDRSAIQKISLYLHETFQTIKSLQTKIIRAVGEKRFEELLLTLKNYRDAIEKAKKTNEINPAIQASVRQAGRKLRQFSATNTMLERKKVSDIIAASRRGLLYFFCSIVVAAVLMTALVFHRILASLKKIERTADSISKGNFKKIEGSIPADELGSAMKAMNSMSEELENRYEQIIQSKKLASLGVLTAGVAHELGNPLNNISMAAQTYIELADSLSKKDALEYMRTIEEETWRIKEIVQNLLDFSKPKRADFQEAEINSVIRRGLKLVYNMFHVSGIDVKLSLAEGLPHVFINANKIQEVLVNLVTNGIQAMSAGGVMGIRTYLREDGEYVVIEVEDNGKGIPPEYLPNIFDPFFSTKGVGGTGLGLSVSYGIIRDHKGSMSVKSEVGVGTTFTIELPVHK